MPSIAVIWSPRLTPAALAAAPSGKRTKVRSSSESTRPVRLPSISALFSPAVVKRLYRPATGPTIASSNAANQKISKKVSHGLRRSGKRSGRRSRGSFKSPPIRAASLAIMHVPPATYTRVHSTARKFNQLRMRGSVLGGGFDRPRPVVAVAALHEPALRFERCEVVASELLGDVAERGARGRQGLHQSLIRGLAFAVLLAAVGGGHLDIAIEQRGQVQRHQ